MLFIVCAVCQIIFFLNRTSTSNVMVTQMYNDENFKFKFSRVKSHLNVYYNLSLERIKAKTTQPGDSRSWESPKQADVVLKLFI